MPVNGLLRLICCLEALADSRPHVATGKYCNNFARVFAFHHWETAQTFSRHQIARFLQSSVLERNHKRTAHDVADSLRSWLAWIRQIEQAHQAGKPKLRVHDREAMMSTPRPAFSDPGANFSQGLVPSKRNHLV